jgi:DNA repair protein RecN (Recombination protein N)
MLRELTIRDFVIVDEVTLELDQGFHVLTGETGAGKSILIDALSLVLGARAAADVVRAGASRAEIHCLIQPPPAALQWLQDNDLYDERDDALIIRRVIDSQGKSRAYINATGVTITQLRELGERLVDIHGQHAHQSLLRPEDQRRLLDSHGALQAQVKVVQAAWRRWQSAAAALRQAAEGAQALEQRMQILGWQLAELQTISPRAGEWEQVTQEHNRLSGGQNLLDCAAKAYSAIDDEETGAYRMTALALEQMRQAQKHDAALSDVIESLQTAEIALGQARSDLARYIDDFEVDPQRLQELDNRMQVLFTASRKYRCEPTELPGLLEQVQREFESLSAGHDVVALEEELKSSEQAYLETAAKLTSKRQEAAAQLGAAVTQKMQSLGMSGGYFKIEVAQANASEHGSDNISFMVAGHKGVPAAALSKVASGGELSRIALAIAVTASQATKTPTLIFDEVDSGVSGAVAEMVGRLLRKLGDAHQVLCITHLPQVAAYAQHHFEVAKQSIDNASVRSSITRLDPAQRIEAVARLLGGLEITDTTRQNAAELIKQAKT